MKKIKRIRPKMLISLLTTFLIVLGIFLVLVITQTTALADEMAINLAENAAENHANAMANVFSKTDDMVLGLKIAAEQFESMPGNDRRAFLDSLLREAVNSEMTQILGAWACFEPDQLDGMDLMNTKGEKAERTDATGRYITYYVNNSGTVERRILTDYEVPGTGDYYLVARDTGKPYVTPPFDSEVNGVATSVLSIAYPVKNRAGKTVGVIGVNYTLDYINALNENVTLFNTGFGKLLTGEGVTVAHKDKTLTGTSDTDFTEAPEAAEIREALGEGRTYAKKMYSPFLGSDTYTAVTNVLLGNSGINWIYAVVVPESEVLASSRAMIAMVMMVAVIGAVVAALIIIVLANNIAKPVRVMCGIANKIAVGDLTTSVPDRFLNHQDEIGDLSRDIKRMQDNLVSTLSGIDAAVDSLHSQVVDGTQAIDVLNDRLFAISTATEELCAGTETTSTSTVKMSFTTADIENAVEMVAEKSEEGAGKSAEIHVRASQLGKNVTGAIDTSNRIFNEIKHALEKALADSKAVEEINALADAILGITSQTTLLALNASIEAARAGEVGRGFAVVAKEISSLADNSKNTVTQIQAITKEVMSAVNALAGSSTDLLNFVSGNVQKDYQDMLTAADSYTNDAVYISDMTTDLNATSQKLMAAIQVMLKGISDVSMSTQEGAIATASLAEQTSGIAGNAASVVENMNQTQRTSEELAELVNQFRL